MARTEYDVVIAGADNGIIVRVGCKTLVFSEKQVEGAMKDIMAYVTEGYRGYDRLGKKYFPDDFCEKSQTEPATLARLNNIAPPTGAGRTDAVPVETARRGRRPRNG